MEGLSLDRLYMSSHFVPAPLLCAGFMKVIRTQVPFLRSSDANGNAEGGQTRL